MSDTVIVAEDLSKRFLVGHQSAQRERYTALRDVIGREVRNFGRKAIDFARGRQIVQGDEVEEFWALQDVSFEVKRGEVLGIIGRNGAGKSTLLKILSRITEPTRGRAILRGRVASLLEVGTGFHPELTGRENIFLNGAILGMTRAEIKSKFDEIIAFAEVERFLDTPVKRYSSGMHVRLAFAVAAHLEPEILIVDEVLAVGDADFQKKCLGKMQDVSTHQGRTILFVSHNMAAIQSLTTRAAVFSNGRIIFNGDTALAISTYSSVLKPIDQKNNVTGRGMHTAIKRVQILDEQRNPTNIYVPGTPLHLEVDFATDGTPGLSIDIFLVGLHRQKLALSSLQWFHGEMLPRKAGNFRAVFSIEPMWIASGPYTLDVTTTVGNTNFDHYVDDAVAFEVLYSNRGNQPWDFSHTHGYGAFALALLDTPNFEKMD